ncbi:transcriptional regulator [Fulvitalea axinellae]|uniref:Transcriptional regulator n=1 Tax=Fulvitalea axinellae TaxID=1182444 RepID=A0AAU9D3X1_9BACT|nr:transcriptional regulator [Fulvitalea axinellae]
MKKKILLIEDNADMRENTAEILELADYEVITADNGKMGVELAQQQIPDLIICDIMMPVLDGYGVLYMLNKSADTASIPFIFLTAKAERSDMRKGMDLGADDYLTKPFDDMELLNAVETRFKKADILQKQFSRDIDGFNDFLNDAKEASIKLESLSIDRKAKRYKRKEIIYHEDAMPNGLFFVSKGKVKAFKTNEDAKEYITGLYKEGDFIGYMALLKDTNYTETAMALEESEICFIPKEDFFDLIGSSRDVSHKFINILANNLKESEDRLLNLAYNSVRQRVAEALLLLESRYKEEGKTKFSMAITREDLANIVGTSTESVIRTLADFKEEGLIVIKGRNIEVLKSDRLQTIKNGFY